MGRKTCAACSARCTRGWRSWCSDEEAALGELRAEQRKSKKPLRAAAARALEKGNPAHVAELERDVIALDDLVGKQRLEELLAVADEMAATRDRLKQLMAEYKKTKSPET